MNPFLILQIFASLSALLIIAWLVLMLARRRGTKATGELCVEAGPWRCTLCGEIVPMYRGEHFPECAEGKVRWAIVKCTCPQDDDGAPMALSEECPIHGATIRRIFSDIDQ